MLSPELKLGIIGYPLEHTLSPVLHQTLMTELGIAGNYQVFETPPDTLAQQLTTLATGGYRGVNITIPHKVAVIPFLKQLSPEAQLVQAVNTIVFGDNGWVGHNTDVIGFSHSLPARMREALPQTHVLILGAGGSARAVLTALIQAQTAQITLAIRSPEKAQAITSVFEAVKAHTQAPTLLQIKPLATLSTLTPYQLVVNTTPVGMAPQTEHSPLAADLVQTLPPNGFVYDLIYRPATTTLMRQCAQQNILTQNGLDMLLYQGVASFRYWSCQEIPGPIIEKARTRLQQHTSTSTG